jgi:hypothetical protein
VCAVALVGKRGQWQLALTAASFRLDAVPAGHRGRSSALHDLRLDQNGGCAVAELTKQQVQRLIATAFNGALAIAAWWTGETMLALLFAAVAVAFAWLALM